MRSTYRAIALFLLLAFLLSCLPAVAKADDTPVAGDEDEVEIESPELELSQESGTVGTKVYVTIHGFKPNQTVEVYFSDITEPVKTWPTDDYGYLKTGFRIPEYPGGRYKVVANDGTNNRSLFFELKSQIAIDKESGLVGDEVVVTGTGFCDDDEVKLYFDGGMIGKTETDLNGSFTATCSIPESSNGKHTIKAEDIADNVDTLDFATQQSIRIEPAEGSPGTEVAVTGSGFNADAGVSISFGDEEIRVVHAGSDGSFAARAPVPGGASGEYTVKADDGLVRDYATFTLVSVASLSAGGDFIGAPLTVTGGGFRPDAEVTVQYDSIKVACSPASAAGSFAITFPAPRSTAGKHIVSVTDGVDSATMTFNVEDSAPPSPIVLSPQDGCKAGKQVYFDWEDVVDPSGVMYRFEVAIDAEFTDVVVSERALLASEYLLTEETPLPRTGNGGAYYWRAKSVDLAGNESPWSAPRSLRVGFTFEMPTWAIYALIAVGVLFALFVAFWFLRLAIGHRQGNDAMTPEGELGVDDVL